METPIIEKSTASTYLKSLASTALGRFFGQASRQTGSQKGIYQGSNISSIRYTTSPRTLLVRKCCEPKNRKNLSEWMQDNQVGVLHTSLDFGTTRAIESENR